MKGTLIQNLTSSIELKQLVVNSSEILLCFERTVLLLKESLDADGTIYFAGNGGSAADSQHLATEFVSKLRRDRPGIPAESLTADTALLTAIGNDYGFEQVFARQVKAKMRSNDVLLAITTSGKSRNIVKALEACREKGIKSILLTGLDGGQCMGLASVAINVPSTNTALIQEAHISIGHSICEAIEELLYFKGTC